MTTNQKAENQNGCKEQTRNVDEGIGSILENLEAYICDKLREFEKDKGLPHMTIQKQQLIVAGLRLIKKLVEEGSNK